MATSSAYANCNSSNELMTSTPDETHHMPFDIPDCPAETVLQNLYYVPDTIIETFFYSSADKLLIRCVYPVIIAFGFITNLSFLWTLARIPDMRNVTNFYLANLACADLINGLCKAVSRFSRFMWSPDIRIFVPWKTVHGCATLATILAIGFFGSMCFVTLVSIERCLAICFPVKHRKISDKTHAVKMVCGAWLVAIIVSVLIAPRWGKLSRFCIIWNEKYINRLPTVVSHCGPVKEEWYFLITIFEFVPYIACLSLNTILYALINRRLSKRNISDVGNNERQNQAKKVRNSVARMLIFNGVVFFLCLSPRQFVQLYYLIVSFTKVYYFDNINMQFVAYVGVILDMLNSAVNPIIYGASNPRYRKAFIAAFTRRSNRIGVADTSNITYSTNTGSQLN